MTNDTQHTALELFATALYEGGYLQGNGDEIQNLLEQHLEINKEQIKKAWVDGNYNTDANGIPSKNYAASDEGYYKKTYGGNK